MKQTKFNTRKMMIIAMMGAMAAILMFFELSVPLAPPFIKFDFSDLPVLIASFLYGPLYGIATAAIKILLKLLIKPTSTAFVGELSNFILTSLFVAIASIIYRFNKTKKGAITGMFVSTLTTSILAVFSNFFVIFPLYATMFGMTMDAIIGMVVAVNPWVKDAMTMFLFSILPFNIFKYGVISLITALIYKKISIVLKRYTE